MAESAAFWYNESMFSNKFMAGFLIFVLFVLTVVFWLYQSQQAQLSRILKLINQRISAGQTETQEKFLSETEKIITAGKNFGGGLSKPTQKKLEDLINAEIKNKLKK